MILCMFESLLANSGIFNERPFDDFDDDMTRNQFKDYQKIVYPNLQSDVDHPWSYIYLSKSIKLNKHNMRHDYSGYWAVD